MISCASGKYYSSVSKLSERYGDNNFNKFTSSHIASLKVFQPAPSLGLFGVSASTILTTMLTNTQTAYDTSRATAATYQSARADQLQTIGKLRDEITDSEKKRYELAVQLYKNLLILLLLNAEQPEKGSIFFDESMLKKRSNSKQMPTASAAAKTNK